jgi:peptide/nickel transport system permease protein
MQEAQTLSHPSAQTPSRGREAEVYVANQWKLVWLKFRRHRLAMFSLVLTVLVYVVAIIPEFLAPYPADSYAASYTYAPPMSVIWIDRSDGVARLAPYVLGYKVRVNAESFAREYTLDPAAVIRIGVFVKGAPYKLLGLFPADTHLIGPLDPAKRVYLLGADRLGRDVLSRLIYGTRISLSIGMIGVTLSLVLGIFLGGISGFFGGWVDNLIQRMVEFLRSLPTIPLWLGLAAAIPKTTPPLQVYFIITIILSFIGWTGLAREVRGRFLSLRSEDYVTAARLDGASEVRVILEQMLPAFTSHIIASVTLSIPQMILSETSLSFLGLGLREPQVSWGVLLQEAQNVRAISQAPWLLIPALAVIITVLAMNFLGDGLRDAADPYAR